MALSTVALDPNIVAIAAAMKVIIVEDMAKIPWPSRRPAMISARKIAELTGERTVVKIDGLIEERIAAKIANSTDEKIGERIGSSIGAKTGEKIVALIAARIGARIARWIDEKIAVRTDKPIGERINGPMQAGSSVDLIERIMWPGDMAVKAEKMPG